MKRTGRPPTRPAKLMDGFYIEVRNRGSISKGIKIRSTNVEAMKMAIDQYKRSGKEVIVLGQYKNEVWLNPPNSPENLKSPDKKKSKELV
jgi:hypothetical protein